MNVLSAIGIVCCLAGFIVSVVGGILYDASIQRYLENLGVAPSPFLYSLSGLRDYLNARKLATRWGHRPLFLKRYERLQVVALALFAVGAFAMLAAHIPDLRDGNG